jgi:transposase
MAKKSFLTSEEEVNLSKIAKKTSDKRTFIRVQSILLANKGKKYVDIAKDFNISFYTVSDYVTAYIKNKDIEFKNCGGPKGKLTQEQKQQILQEIDERNFATAAEVADYIEKKYNVKYNVRYISNWLRESGFSYKQPAQVPAKADPEKQERFIAIYDALMAFKTEDSVVLHIDAVHPTMATKFSRMWIRTGINKTLDTSASRTRLNYIGAINLEEMRLIVDSYDTINSEFVITFLKKVKEAYPNKKIYIILDNGAYHCSKKTKEAAKGLEIELIFLPPYSPNLNPIERVWKVSAKYARNNKFFAIAGAFVESMETFFKKTWNELAESLRSWVNDNFSVVKKNPIGVKVFG